MDVPILGIRTLRKRGVPQYICVAVARRRMPPAYEPTVGFLASGGARPSHCRS